MNGMHFMILELDSKINKSLSNLSISSIVSLRNKGIG